MLSGVSTICFAASYTVALALEISRLLFRSGVRRVVMLGFAGAGLLAHTAFLYYRAAAALGKAAAPLSSEKDWYLVAAWALVVAYVYFALLHPKAPFGLFLLPLSLGLIGAATWWAKPAPLGRESASQAWGAIHGISIVLAAVAVLIGFVAGLMYLGQVRHLKHKILPTRGLRLPSLEWLQRINSRAIVASAVMLGVGVLSGMILNLINIRNEGLRLNWNDPVVISTWLMLFWLSAAAILSAVYRPARQGRKVAYLTVASFVFLVIILAAGLLMDSRHWGRGARGEGRGARGENSRLLIDDWSLVIGHWPFRSSMANDKSPMNNDESVGHGVLSPFPSPLSSPASALYSPLSPLPSPLSAMLVQVVGCSHHGTSIALRERLAFSAEQRREALDRWRRAFPGVEAVLLSTCNRVEVYAATDRPTEPSLDQIADFLARFHGLEPAGVAAQLYRYSDEAAVRHLFIVASSLDSMVLGEPQILAQVKDAYQVATEQDNTGPLMHAMFQAALHVARRVAKETAVHQRHVSVASVAVADFARQVFERFDDKEALVIGAGEMAEETLRYLQDEGVRRVTVVNRHLGRAVELAHRWRGQARPWDELLPAVAAADLVVSATAAGAPTVTREEFAAVKALRFHRPLVILDLAVPRDFDPGIGDEPDVYLYSIDDLREACGRNQRQRDKELPAAMHVVEQETARFLAEINHRAVGPVIEQLRSGWQKPKEDEFERLLHKLPELDDRAKEEIRRSFDRLVNKLLHPPLASLRDESREGVPRGLLHALARLFQLKD